MNILVVCQYFYPEEFKVNDLVEGLVLRGHKVTVLTGKPNYPKGEFFTGYKFSGIQKEEYKGAEVIRVPLIRRGKSGALRLALNYLSFVFFGNRYIRKSSCEYDTVLVYQLSPVTMAYPGIKAKKKCGARLALYVQDLWPESVSATSSIKGGPVLKILNRVVRRVYSESDVIFVQSRAFHKSIEEKGDFTDKIVYAPNWAEDLFVNNSLADPSRYKHLIPDGFRVMFAGNIGEAQDFDNIINAATCTKGNKSIIWVIVGDGRAREKAELRIIEENLQDTVVFLGRHPIQEMPSFFCHADAMLVSLKKEFIFSLTIPSKVQAYMASGKPILSMIDGEGKRVVEESGSGITACAEDYMSLVKNVLCMYEMPVEERVAMGKKGLMYYEENFSKEKILDRIESSLISLKP